VTLLIFSPLTPIASQPPVPATKLPFYLPGFFAIVDSVKIVLGVDEIGKRYLPKG